MASVSFDLNHGNTYYEDKRGFSVTVFPDEDVIYITFGDEVPDDYNTITYYDFTFTPRDVYDTYHIPNFMDVIELYGDQNESRMIRIAKNVAKDMDSSGFDTAFNLCVRIENTAEFLLSLFYYRATQDSIAHYEKKLKETIQEYGEFTIGEISFVRSDKSGIVRHAVNVILNDTALDAFV